MAYVYGGGAAQAYARPAGVAQQPRVVGAAPQAYSGGVAAYGGGAAAYGGGAVLAGGYAQAAPRVVGGQPAQARVLQGGVQQAGAARYAQPAQYAQPAAQYVQPAAQYAPQVMAAGNVTASAANQKTVETVENLLANREELKTAVIKAFKHVAGTGEKTDITGLLKIRSELSQKLGLPEQIFGSIQDEYIRFDFDGSGYLEANEVYKLVKFHLYEFLPHQHGSAGIPTKTLRQAGLQVTKTLGAGSQGDVKLAVDARGNARCVKCYKKDAMMNLGGLSNMQEEFETMQRLACKNIARTFEIFQDNQFVYMINEVYMGKDLCQVEQHALAQRVPITEDWWRGIFRQCFEALSFMHQQAMMHCDIKEPNMMLRSEDYRDPQVVLIDFGVSKAMTAKDDGTASGTPGYMPPETMNTGKWYPGGDIFSMGVVMMQLLTRKVPDEDKARQGIMIGIFLEGCRSIEDIKMAMNSRQPPFQLMPAQWPGLKQLVMRCLEKNMKMRPKAPTVLRDPWFGNMAIQVDTPVEQAMQTAGQELHPLATVGITDQMIMDTPATCAIAGQFPPVGAAGAVAAPPVPSIRQAAAPAAYTAAKAPVQNAIRAAPRS